MPRPLNKIIAHIRAVSANPDVSTTLIQTEDLLALCDAAEGNYQQMVQRVLASEETPEQMPIARQVLRTAVIPPAHDNDSEAP